MPESRVTLDTFIGTITTKPLDQAEAERIAEQARAIQQCGEGTPNPGITAVTLTPAEQQA